MNSKNKVFYNPDEIYDGISRGKLNKKDLGWNIWLGIGFLSVIIVWIIIYSSRLLKIAYTYNNDNLMSSIEFENDMTQFGYDIGELSLSILTFCIQQSEPTLVNIPVRLGLSDQIMKQRYKVRNYLDTFSEIKLPNGMEDKDEVIREISERTSNLLANLVPLNIRFEDQPSPISPAPPPYYKPERTNITEFELKESIESNSNTFLAAKYLCNNTDYISEESNYIMFKAMELTNPAKLFDFEYLNKFALEHDYIKYETTRAILIFHYIIVIIVVLSTFIIFYLGTYDYFQKNNRLKIMRYCKLQISDTLERVIRTDGTNRRLMIDSFVPMLKIFKNIGRICDGIIKEYGNKLDKMQANKLSEIKNSTCEFESYVNLSIKYSEIMRDIVDNYGDDSNQKHNFNFIDIIDLIESEEYNDNFNIYNNHFFTKNINNRLFLSGTNEQFSKMLNSLICSLGLNEKKSIYWDIMTVKDDLFIPDSMMNSLGEIGKSVIEVLSSNWNLDTEIEKVENKSFLVIDFVLNKSIDNDKSKCDDCKSETGVGKITKYLNYMIAKRMAGTMFGGIIVNNNNHGVSDLNYNETLCENELFNVKEFFNSQEMESSTLIIPLKNFNYTTSNSISNNYSNCSYIKNEIVICSCGIDHYHSNIFESVSRLFSYKYTQIDFWELKEKERILEYLVEKSRYWLFDVTSLDLLKKDPASVNQIREYSYYTQNDIEVILLSVSSLSIEVLFEFDNKFNFVDYYYKLKSLSDFKTDLKHKITKNETDKDIEYDYRKIIKLFNRPIKEIKPDLFTDTDQFILNSDENKELSKDSSLISDKIFTLVNIQEMLANQINVNSSHSSKGENGENFNYKNKITIYKPKELDNSWKSIDVLVMSSTQIKRTAEYLIHYRYMVLINDKKKYKEDITKWPINMNKIVRFVQELEDNYHEKNPFHNFRHAVSVSVTLNQWLEKPSIKKYVNSLEAYCLIISALGHDLDHPGLNNDIMKDILKMYKNIQSSYDDITKMLCEVSNISTLDIYNGISLLENHHTSLLFSILNDESCNIFIPSWSIYFEELKKIVVNAILFTDMEYHMHIRNYLNEFNKHLEYNREDEYIYKIKKKFYLSALLHSADISNPLMDTCIYIKWSDLIFQEFKNQIRVKEMLNINKQDDFCVENDNVRQQISFLKNICIGYFESLNRLDTFILEDSIQNLYNNYNYYLNFSE
ncbi:hypothetical protein FG386_002193 [Cryptosporidium ryanae]|uniref:uncharacterized protein n=1 Tax=Cryptosporidium ryanae TaxID=515981 RepID=UPI00351A0DAF|nr:hypothetical protein FG386_002193 [Cryptosporidium ryanae]